MRPQLRDDDIAQYGDIQSRLHRLSQSMDGMASFSDRLSALESLRGLVRAANFIGPWTGTANSDKTITGLVAGDYLVSVQAGAYRTTTGPMGVDFYFNGVLSVRSLVFANEANSHKSCNTANAIVSITGTDMLIQLRDSSPGGVSSSSDGNDRGSVLVIPALLGAVI